MKAMSVWMSVAVSVWMAVWMAMWMAVWMAMGMAMSGSSSGSWMPCSQVVRTPWESRAVRASRGVASGADPDATPSQLCRGVGHQRPSTPGPVQVVHRRQISDHDGAGMKVGEGFGDPDPAIPFYTARSVR